MSDVVTRAAEYARAAHASIDQRRKYTNEPYIVHPQAVAEIVCSVTDDAGMIAAAWLHDVVEDTPVTIQQIDVEFGQDIASLVADLTNVATAADGNRAARKALNRRHSAAAAPRAKTVKLADVIDNVSGIASADRDFARLFLREKELLLGVLTEGNSNLYRQAQQVVRASLDLLASQEP